MTKKQIKKIIVEEIRGIIMDSVTEKQWKSAISKIKKYLKKFFPKDDQKITSLINIHKTFIGLALAQGQPIETISAVLKAYNDKDNRNKAA